MGLKRTTAATVQPVTLAELKEQVGQGGDLDDRLLERLIKAATAATENYTGRAWCTQTWTLKLARFPSWTIRLPRPPVQSANFQIDYLDSDGNSQTLDAANYRLTDNCEPAVVTPSYSNTWPTTRVVSEAVTVVYQAGYGGRDDVPEDARHAILLLAADLYANREANISGTTIATVPMGIQWMLGALKVAAFPGYFGLVD